MIRLNFLIAALCIAATSGCVSSGALEPGKTLIARGDTEAGLQALQSVTAGEPDNASYRGAYLRAREKAIAQWMYDASVARQTHQDATAEADYLKVLRYDRTNNQAQSGLQAIERAVRRSQIISKAETDTAKGDGEAAITELRQVLAEDPNNVDAQKLLGTIEQRLAAPSIDTKLEEVFQKPLSIEFHDATLRQIFEVISRTAGLSFVFDKDVKADQKATIFLHDATVASAVHALLLTNQLEQRVLDSKTILIYPNTPAKIRDYQPLSVKSFFLSTSDAKTVGATLKTVLKTKDIVVDEKQNMVIIHDTPQAIRIAEKLVALHEMPEPEVMLDVEILEVQRSRLLDLGIQYPNQLSLTPLADANGNVTLQQLKSLSASTIGATISPLIVNANQTLSDANILANPRIRTRNHEKAKVQVGERLPNVTTTIASAGFASENIQYIDVGLKLEVEPSIFPNDEVGIKVALEVSSVLNQITTKSGSTAYEIGTRNATTVLRLQDGENQILAGLINDQETRDAQRIPGLGDLPLLGRIFGSQQNSADRTEIILSITPHLVRNLTRPSLQAGEFDTGTEGSMGGSGFTGGSGQGGTVNTTLALNGSGAAAATASPDSGGAIGATSAPDKGGFGSSFIGDPPATETGGSAAGTPAGYGVGASGIATSGGVGSGATATTIAFTGATQATIGSQFAVGVTIQPGQPIVTAPATFAYDPKVLEVIGVAAGSFFSEGGQAGTFTSKVDPVNGLVTITATTGSSVGNNDPGTLFTVTFQGTTASGGTQIQLQSIAPTGASGQPISVTPPSADIIVVSP